MEEKENTQNKLNLPHIICIMGPTCSSKSLLGEKLHDLIPSSKIINFDAYQIFKSMDIGTAKPSKEELEKGYYYFYDLKDLTWENNIYSYQKMVRPFLDENKDSTLILIGGSGLYLKALLFNYLFNEEDVKMPDDYYKDATNEEIWNILMEKDPSSLKNIHINNRKRLLRALFINETSNHTKEEVNENKHNELLYPDSLFIFINPDRSTLYEKINLRVDKMREMGLTQEALDLLSRYPTNTKALEAIGYKEFKGLLDESLTEDEVYELIKKNTRNYAKRQVTFFKHQFPQKEEFLSPNDAYTYILETYKLPK